MRKRTDRTSDSTPANEVMRFLKENLGEEWAVTSNDVNSLNFGLPQSRDRIYVIGRRKSAYRNGCPSSLPHFKKE